MTIANTGAVRISVGKLLRERGVSVRELVERTGMSYNTALALARGTSSRLDLDTLARVCDALDVEVSDLLVYERGTRVTEGA